MTQGLKYHECVWENNLPPHVTLSSERLFPSLSLQLGDRQTARAISGDRAGTVAAADVDDLL